MKLAKIDHDRCQEISATTYVWVHDDMTSETLHKYVASAQKLYLDNEDAIKNTPGVSNPGFYPQYSLYPNLTVSQVDAIHKEKLAAYTVWIAKKNATRKHFAELLEEVGEGNIKGFYGVSPALDITVSWGHRHGTTIEYSEVNVYSKDFNAPETDNGL